ncbi:uncharacterized protein LOC128554856 [Mercenaria mercenaria]|uniref:uncharacterized protein LOC128554856 n=1 Tax=Mercenaria mercenaria TaxID=6596 RepID=UPI00234E65C4|nr:uncharacterized protein LOC128554856 [Mercenaria mercenaria]
MTNAAEKVNAISETGGWCPKETNVTQLKDRRHWIDRKLIAALSIFFKDKYVGSFGDGSGQYKQLLLNYDTLKGYDAFDGGPFCETTTNGFVKYLDLTIPQYGLRLYDWILCLEVAEHIPRKFEGVFIDNIVRHAHEGVVLSWAKLGQHGQGHVNNRPFEYVKDLMRTFGFAHSIMESQHLKNATEIVWLNWNVNVFRRQKMILAEDMKMYT